MFHHVKLARIDLYTGNFILNSFSNEEVQEIADNAAKLNQENQLAFEGSSFKILTHSPLTQIWYGKDNHETQIFCQGLLALNPNTNIHIIKNALMFEVHFNKPENIPTQNLDINQFLNP
jgi:hypothetical protein